MNKFVPVEITADQAPHFEALGLEVRSQYWVMVPDLSVQEEPVVLALPAPAWLTQQPPALWEQPELPFHAPREFKKCSGITNSSNRPANNRSPLTPMRIVYLPETKRPPKKYASRGYYDKTLEMFHREFKYDVMASGTIPRREIVERLKSDYFPHLAINGLTSRVTEMEKAGFLVPVL